MNKSKWVVVAVLAASLATGCAAVKGGRGSQASSGGGGSSIAEGDLVRIEEAANRAEAAANRAEAAADRAALASEKAETMFRRGLRK